MTVEPNRILPGLLDRLYHSLVHGPCLNCRVHRSRQRIDLTALADLQDVAPAMILPQLLGDARKVEIKGQATPFLSDAPDESLTPEQRAVRKAYRDQARLLGRLRDMAEDASDYEKETGEGVLYIGYPFLSVPPGLDVNGQGSVSSRVLAPLALVPVEVAVKRGAVQSVTLSAKGDGMDLVIPNYPFLAWLEQQTGEDTSDLFEDEDGSQPWTEIHHIARHVAKLLRMEDPPAFTPDTLLDLVPRMDALPERPAFLPLAVLGLFPVSNQGLLRDLKAMVQGESLDGPVAHFLSADVARPLPDGEMVPAETDDPTRRRFDQERMVAPADPFQARAVRDSEAHPMLVIHGPPGTGKSQTITNIISDHLARGERVLLVCDKRTAIDVVKNRLDHLGLGDLCAVVYDPQRDQRTLYMKIRHQLESLPERKTDPRAESKMQKTDAALQALHDELLQCHAALLRTGENGAASFHDLVGEWLALNPAADLDASLLASADLADLEPGRPVMEEILERGRTAGYASNPWTIAARMSLADYLSRPAAELRDRMGRMQVAARELDQTCNSEQPPLVLAHPLDAQEAAFTLLADSLETIAALNSRSDAAAWFVKPAEAIAQVVRQFKEMEPARARVEAASLHAELLPCLAGNPPAVPDINRQLAALNPYNTVAAKWYGFLCFGKRRAAGRILETYGLPLTLETGRRLSDFLEGVKARLICGDFLRREFAATDGVGATAPANHDGMGGLPRDSDLLTAWTGRQTMMACVDAMRREPTLAELQDWIRDALATDMKSAAAAARATAARASRIREFLRTLQSEGLFADNWLSALDERLRQHGKAGPELEGLIGKLDTLEGLLRLREARQLVPDSLKAAIDALLAVEAEPMDGLDAVRRHLLATVINQRIREDACLQQVDSDGMTARFRRYRELEERKRELVRETILHRWIGGQQERLLAGTRTQLNGAGAALKRRLLTRGERSMKLRQVIRQGAQAGEPDPLFDVCPVWMASPSTVAQIFPRAPIFDVLVFDEASQCRLEEALPVLTRGRRVAIAGDPKQLPPTRFFEASFTASDVEEAESDQDLFELQQVETEDLLGAALNIQVQQCYLNVHYRSRHEALIGFSNRHFYHDRLQPLPAHPASVSLEPPIGLIRAEGVYTQRANEREAAQVVALVRDLLSQPNPPSIGIACFNLVQRDLILDRLEEAVAADTAFAGQFETARERRGEGSFEGLFVKNLENVQGDERDHIIISTTFGPDPKGTFRRHFGPLGRAGGGRRLNVLITRAREKIHLVTSIPRSEYAALPALDPGQIPGGRWLLYAYLQYAESLETESAAAAEDGAAGPGSTRAGRVQVHPLRVGSPLAEALGRRLAMTRERDAEVHWGNDGFCVDIVLRDPAKAARNAIGILCDMNRFDQASDPIEWEVFKTGILESKGWKFRRAWSPGLFLDPERHVNL